MHVKINDRFFQLVTPISICSLADRTIIICEQN
jgi:hypothetical protein